MKKQHLLVLTFLLFYNLCNAQFTYYHANNDAATNTALAQINTSLAAHIASNSTMLTQVASARIFLNEQLRHDYTKLAKYDKQSDFITGSVLKASMAIGGEVLKSTFAANNTPYFTANKAKYMNEINKNSLNLLWLQFMSASDIRSSDRQAIYRIRRDILRTYSKDEAHVRSLILLSAAAAAFQSDSILFSLLKGGNIIF